MKKTPNFHLSQWDSTDRIIMNDFNDDNKKVDAALAKLQAEKADRTTADDLQTQVNARATLDAFNTAVTTLQRQLDKKIQLAYGAYTGNDAATRTISLGFQPKAVYLCMECGASSHYTGSYHIYGGLALQGHPLMVPSPSPVTVMETTSSGFKVYGSAAEVNNQYHTYYYIALG